MWLFMRARVCVCVVWQRAGRLLRGAAAQDRNSADGDDQLWEDTRQLHWPSAQRRGQPALFVWPINHIFIKLYLYWWICEGYWLGSWLGHWLVIERLRVRLPAGQLPSNNSGQVVHTHVPLSPSSIIWYRPKGGAASTEQNVLSSRLKCSNMMFRSRSLTGRLFHGVPPGPYKSLKVLKFHTFKYKALKSPQKR